MRLRTGGAPWPAAPNGPPPGDPTCHDGSVYLDEKWRLVDVDRVTLWRVIEGIGGNRGWYSLPLVWTARGWVDRLVGGVGLRRGRRDPDRLRAGEALDFWRVEEIRDGELLRLRTEMKLPGTAWLELRADTDEQGRTVLRQRSIFQPRGLSGHVYWSALAPLHGVVFGRMARNLTAAARRQQQSSAAGPSDGAQQQNKPA